MKDERTQQPLSPQSSKPPAPNPLDPWKNIKPIPLAPEERAKK